MAKEKFEITNELKADKDVEKSTVGVDEVEGTEGTHGIEDEMSDADRELAEINEAIAFGKQTESFLKKHPGILEKAGEMAEKVLPTNKLRKYWDKLPKEAQMALLYADLGTNANVITSPIAVPLRFLRKAGMIDYKGDKKESDIDRKASVQKGIEWLAKHYPETAEIAGPLIELKDGFAELGKDVRQGVKEERRKNREARASKAKAEDVRRVNDVKERIKSM